MKQFKTPFCNFQIIMGECCGGEDETDYDPSDRGPISKRRCTDVPCLLLLLAFVGAWIGVGCYSFTFGNPALLVYPSNSEGEICGRGAHKDEPFLLFFDMTKCARLSAFLGCPTPQVKLVLGLNIMCLFRCVWPSALKSSGPIKTHLGFQKLLLSAMG